jgi:hypothetical protein
MSVGFRIPTPSASNDHGKTRSFLLGLQWAWPQFHRLGTTVQLDYVPSKTGQMRIEFNSLSRVRSTESSGFMERAMGIEQIRMNQTKALPPVPQFNWSQMESNFGNRSAVPRFPRVTRSHAMWRSEKKLSPKTQVPKPDRLKAHRCFIGN